MDSSKETRVCVARRKIDKERNIQRERGKGGKEGERERERERERELGTHAPRGFSKFADHGMAARGKSARVTARGRESDPQRGWKNITELERKREKERERERKREGKRERDGQSGSGTAGESEEEGGRGCGVASVPAQWPGHRVLCPGLRALLSSSLILSSVIRTVRCVAVVIIVVIIATFVLTAKSLPCGVLSCPANIAHPSFFRFLSLSLSLSIILSFSLSFLSLSLFLPLSWFSLRRIGDRTNRASSVSPMRASVTRRGATTPGKVALARDAA